MAFIGLIGVREGMQAGLLELMAVLILFGVVLNVAMLYLFLDVRATTAKIGNQVKAMNNIDLSNFTVPGIEDIKEEVLDIIDETLSQIQMPKAGDHLMGMVSTFLQMKMASMVPSGIGQLVEPQDQELHSE